jgi:hypothetical protein
MINVKDLLQASLTRFDEEEFIDDEERLVRLATTMLNGLIFPWSVATAHEALTELAENEDFMIELVGLLQQGMHETAGALIVKRMFSYWTDFAVKHSAADIARQERIDAEDRMIAAYGRSRAAASQISVRV